MMSRPTLLGWAFLSALAFPASLHAADETKPKADAPKLPIVVELTIKGLISEEPSPVGFEGTPISDNLQGVIDRIAKAKADKDVKALVLRIRSLSVGWARAHELREAIKSFRVSGKKVYAYLEEVDIVRA